jgi:hypothetical protein
VPAGDVLRQFSSEGLASGSVHIGVSISTSISRFTVYFRRHGFCSTLHRVGLAVRRALFANRMVLFYCDLSTLGSPLTELPSSLKVERRRSRAELSPQDLQEITSFWNPDLACRNMEERFGLGASIWLTRFGDHLAGYGWTLQGRTVEPHYFRLGLDDVHLFDFHVFAQCRGRKINPMLVSYILHSLAVECPGRAFIEAAEWNRAQLASLRSTPFRRLGTASKFTVLRRTIVCWHEHTAEKTQGYRLEDTRIPATDGQGTPS